MVVHCRQSTGNENGSLVKTDPPTAKTSRYPRCANDAVASVLLYDYNIERPSQVLVRAMLCPPGYAL